MSADHSLIDSRSPARDPEHLRDHGDGQGIGQVADHLHRPRIEGPVDDLVDDLLDARAESLDHPGRERPADQRAQARVVRRILEEHGARQALLRGHGPLPYIDSRKPSNPALPKRWSRRTATQSS